MVETRSGTKTDNTNAVQGASTVANGNPPVTAPTAVVDTAGQPSATTSVSGSSGTVRSRTLNIEADYALKIAKLERAAAERAAERERAALERERAALELERTALELRKQAELAAVMEGGSVRSKSSRSSHISNKEIHKWLNKCVDSIQVDVTKEPQDVVITDSSVKRPTVNFIQRPEVALVPQQVPNNNDSCLADNSTFPIALKPGTLSTNNNNCTPSSDIAQLAQAIASLSSRNVSRPKFWDGRLPVFDGKALDWLTFNKTYENTKVEYSTSDNLARINYALKGAAREAVAVLLVSARNPSEVMEALAVRFGRPEHIVLQEVSTLRALPKINNDGSDLHKFACRVRNSAEVMRLLNQSSYLESPEIFQSVLSKLTPLLRTRWADYASNYFSQQGDCTKLELLARFLIREVDLQLKFGLITEPITYVKKGDKVHVVQADDSSSSSNPRPSSAKTHEKLNNKLVSNDKKSCCFCSESHDICQCSTFKSLSVTDRWQFVKDKKLCHKCLQRGSHNYKNCNIKKEVCNDKKCRSAHHRLLHVAYVVESEDDHEDSASPTCPELADSDKSSNVEVTEFIAHANSSAASNRPLLKVVPVTVSGPTGSEDTYALLDDGSTATFIDADLAARIGARGPVVETHLRCVGGLSKDTQVEYVDFDVKGHHVSKMHRVNRARSLKSLQLAKQSVSPHTVNDYPFLSELKSVLCYDNVQPKVVIGIDNWHLTIPQAVRKGSKSQPVAIKTALGWVLFGFSSSRTRPVELLNHLFEEHVDNNQNQLLENMIKEQYKLDSIGISKKTPHSADNLRAVQTLDRTANRLPCGRFEVGLLWKSDSPVVPNSYPLALSRFLSLEKKMLRDPVYAERYKLNIHEMINKDYAEKCQIERSPDSVCWYLPHFGIENPNKPAKLRVVHDAAAKTHGVSLNSLLLTGPDLLQSLYDILLRFREGKVAMTADIKEMFPRFKIIEQDQDAQRFLWRDNSAEPIQTYRMSSMIFGAVSSPFTALYMKNKNALEVKDQFPQAAHAIVHDTYMDDYIGSVSSSDIAASLAADIVKVHARAGLEMRGWVSNDPSALKLLPKSLISETVCELNVSLANLPSSTPSTRALGLYWHPTTDLLSFNTPGEGEEAILPIPLTKRKVLSLIMKVFDPLGILAPVVIRGRILFQNVWRMNLDWDTQFLCSEIKTWNDWFQDLILTTQLKIPRCYNPRGTDPSQVELHVFADASAQAYTAVAYWRFLYLNGDVQLALVSSKSRVTPLKPCSIPRLELQAALIAARLASSIVDAVRLKPHKRIFWCDSMNVLGWLRNDARTYKPFVAHRVGEIIELTDVREWRWVPTSLNVADDATRLGRGPLTPESRWIKGPDFLLTSDWPEEPVMTIGTTHETHTHVINIISNDDHSLSANARRFSSWFRLIRATAYAHRYLSLLRLHSLRKKNICVDFNHKVQNHILTFNLPPTPNVNSVRGFLPRTLTSDDLHLAMIHVFRKSQIDSFSEEIRSIRNNLPVSRRSRLFKLSAIIDSDNILRLSSRIAAVKEVPEAVKSPILLDGKHPAVRLLVLDYHRKAAHACTEMIVNELRQKYWILSLRSTVRSVAFNCQFCKVRRSVAFQPPIGDLPAARLSHHCRPFSFVGLDYFGPITVKIGRRTEKRWVGLFTCLTVRAIHLEVVHSLSSDAAIMALRRFIARRGTPTEIHSDNGTSFVGANRELRTLYEEAVPNFAASEMIKWRFIPPSAPFMGGAWERLIKSVKTALKVTLGNNVRTPTDEILFTLLCEAEALVNSRPLTHVANDPQHPEALTPNHFLLGYSSGRPIPAELTDSDVCSRAGWKRAVRMADHFWNRWVVEYLPTLSPRRAIGTAPLIAIGDMVVVADGTLPRGSWPKGRITATYPGKDGVTRVVDIATKGGILRRPLKKVVPLL